MNARQKCKKLKRRNKLLMDIVNANPDFFRVFDYWTNKPFKVEPSHLRLQTYAAAYPIDPMFGDKAREIAENHIVEELSHAMKRYIEWRVEDYDPHFIRLEGRIRIAAKGGD